ncbi:MAG: LPS assembly lipoprotein LptE [Bacteroidota bacterium]
MNYLKKIALSFGFLLVLSSCWPTSISFKDKGSMPEEWHFFSVKTLENNAPNSPLSYPANLSEAIKDGVQNNTRLKLNSGNVSTSEVQIEGVITNYAITPIALQEGDVAAKNRLTISASFSIFIKKPKEDEMKLTSTRFFDYDSNSDFNSVEANLIEEINKQIVQDVINKLLSNW